MRFLSLSLHIHRSVSGMGVCPSWQQRVSRTIFSLLTWSSRMMVWSIHVLAQTFVLVNEKLSPLGFQLTENNSKHPSIWTLVYWRCAISLGTRGSQNSSGDLHGLARWSATLVTLNTVCKHLVQQGCNVLSCVNDGIWPEGLRFVSSGAWFSFSYSKNMKAGKWILIWGGD